MTYRENTKRDDGAREYFAAREGQFPGVAAAMQTLFDAPSLNTARELMKAYFGHHQQGDIESLEKVTSVFASKMRVSKIVDSVLADEEEINGIAERSYPHPIGFDKLVLYHDQDSGFKLRLHVYWRGNQRAAMERLHLHKFEMASAIVAGELTNHIWKIKEFDNSAGLVRGIQTEETDGAREQKKMYAYSGYRRDKEGVLHNTFLGEALLERGETRTMISGQSYAQLLSDGHYVETNAETGISNGDICSTIYIHGPSLTDESGRKIPILFEEFRLAADDKVIDPIPSMTPEYLRGQLTKYRDFLNQSIEFYDWLYDEKHGRNLSVGMIAGYLLAESHKNPHVLSLWVDHEHECKEELRAHEKTLRKLVNGEMNLSDLSEDDRTKRYFAILLDKALTHPRGKEYFLDKYGDLVKEMWRYCGAIRGEKPEITELKPMWTGFVGRDLPGGAHYGHVAAMIEAAYKAREKIMPYFNMSESSRGDTWKEDDSPVSRADPEAEEAIRSTLQEYFPAYRFKGEESGEDTTQLPQEGERRWLVDAIDGTRNFNAGRNDFCIMMACQKFEGGKWVTTDSLIADPVHNKIWWAEKGQGAFCIEGHNREDKMIVPHKHIFDHYPADEKLHGRMIDLSIKGLPIDAEMSFRRILREEESVERNMGSTGLMLVSAGDGRSDGVVVTAHDYDIEPGLLIAREAGAAIREVTFNAGPVERTAFIAAADDETADALKTAVEQGLQAVPKPPGPQPPAL